MEVNRCEGCGELATEEDCICCDKCRKYPCECICERCGERTGDGYMDRCECVE